jgi:hypothetical protein
VIAAVSEKHTAALWRGATFLAGDQVTSIRNPQTVTRLVRVDRGGRRGGATTTSMSS